MRCRGGEKDSQSVTGQLCAYYLLLLPTSLLHIGGTCVLPSANSVGRVARLVLAYLWECAIEKTSKQSRGGGGRRGSELEGERESELVASVGKQTEKSAKLRE